jgi:hypothetical protein
MILAFAAFAAIMSLVNFVALACVHYNLQSGYYRTRLPNGHHQSEAK